MHQTIRAAMTKKTTTLTNAVVHYNRDCAKLAKMCPKGCFIPLPKPLPTTLAQLKACPELMESVWIEPVDSEKQCCIFKANICNGICAVHQINQCAEEALRLG
jgi:phage tail protein X